VVTPAGTVVTGAEAVLATGVATGAAGAVVTVRSEATPVTPLRGAKIVNVAARPITPAIIKMTPIVWIFTPVAVLCTAKVRTAPTAIRKTEKPIRMRILRSMAATQPYTAQLPDVLAVKRAARVAGAKTGAIRQQVGATGFEPVTARV
jgi:hypothetical protein